MPYLRITCPDLDPAARRAVAAELTAATVELFTPPRGLSADEIRARTTVHFTCYGGDELFVAGRAAAAAAPDVTVELSDWYMSVHQRRRVSTRLTPLLVALLTTTADQVNIRFHSYPPTALAVAGQLLADRVPRVAQWAKRVVH